MKDFWQTIRDQALQASADEPALASYYYTHVLNHKSFAACLSFTLSESLGNNIVPSSLFRDVISEAFEQDSCIEPCAKKDIEAVLDRDAACNTYLAPLLNFKGYKALQCHRIAHYLWNNNRQALALFFQSTVSERFHVDIHPNATIGCGIFIDHATNIVIGETTIVGDNVSMLHSITLGGSGSAKQCKRHPSIGSGVLIAAGSKVLGPVTVGDGAKIAAGSVVVDDVDAFATVAGVPAKVVRRGLAITPALDMQQTF